MRLLAAMRCGSGIECSQPIHYAFYITSLLLIALQGAPYHQARLTVICASSKMKYIMTQVFVTLS